MPPFLGVAHRTNLLTFYTENGNFFHNKYTTMERHQKIYFIIQERKGATLQDLINVTGWKRISVLRAIIKLLYKRKIISTDYLGTKFFVINPKVSKYA